MKRPMPMRFRPQTPIKVLRVEFIRGYWRIWMTANGDFTLGTFIELDEHGAVRLITLHPDGTESIFEVTDEQEKPTS